MPSTTMTSANPATATVRCTNWIVCCSAVNGNW